MSNIRENLIRAALSRAFALIDYHAHNNLHEQHEFMQQTILADNSLTEEEKSKAIRLNNKDYDREKIIFNVGTRRVCENCNQKCLATLYCCFSKNIKIKFAINNSSLQKLKP
ncbi:hypothetical protein RhiirA5_420798 [Rhizophagus irregularis]|uniref:Uncharacterized protein n=1 Tax=Rhizophagus irregularis TaxID=588596 RepID=A0A2N0PFC2_9GLOM|nr:hypothetical protein RhiirA5_420798 [Rhizophagus irregularis]